MPIRTSEYWTKTDHFPDKPFIVCNKDLLRNIVAKKDRDYVVATIKKAVANTNKIVFHTYNFIKLYFIHLYDQKLDFPIIDKTFVKHITILVARRKNTAGRKPNIDKKISDFFDDHYKPLISSNDLAFDDNLSYILQYEIDDIIKNIETNIKEHYAQHVRRFINKYFHLDHIINEINNDKTTDDKYKKEYRSFVRRVFKAVKDDILNTGPELNSDEYFHDWIYVNKYRLVPFKEKYEKDSILYDVHVHPQSYLYSMFNINRSLDKMDENIKLFEPLSLRTNISYRYITIDTSSLVSLFITEGKREMLNKVTTTGRMLWDELMRTEKKSFNRKHHRFNFMIKTDGIGCSIVFTKVDRNENPVTIPKDRNKLEELNNPSYSYIEDIEITDEMKNRKIVTIDPGHNDLITCYMEENNEYFNFRYTRKQRDCESRNTKYKKIRENIKRKTKIGGKTVKEIEAELSYYNSKKCTYNDFSNYVKEKVIINRRLYKHYEMDVHRKLKFNLYTNTRRSESRLVNNFKRIYGDNDEVLILYGDYDKNETMKGSEPHISKRLRKILRQAKYNIHLINEYNTSKLCNQCGKPMENFILDAERNLKSWKLLQCKSVNCKTIHDRDLNATRNMLNIWESLKEGNGRPERFRKKYNCL